MVDKAEPRDPASRTIGRWELRKRAHYRKPQGAPHPWNKTAEGSADRWSTAPGELRHLVKDGRALTDRGAELLLNRKLTAEDHAWLDERYGRPPHSQSVKASQ